MDIIVHAFCDYSSVQNLDANALTVNSLALDPLFEIERHAICSGVSTASRPRVRKMRVVDKKGILSYPSYSRAV